MLLLSHAVVGMPMYSQGGAMKGSQDKEERSNSYFSIMIGLAVRSRSLRELM